MSISKLIIIHASDHRGHLSKKEFLSFNEHLREEIVRKIEQGDAEVLISFQEINLICKKSSSWFSAVVNNTKYWKGSIYRLKSNTSSLAVKLKDFVSWVQNHPSSRWKEACFGDIKLPDFPQGVYTEDLQLRRTMEEKERHPKQIADLKQRLSTISTTNSDLPTEEIYWLGIIFNEWSTLPDSFKKIVAQLLANKLEKVVAKGGIHAS